MAPNTLDCGARTALVFSGDVQLGSPAFYPLYGCDRYAMFQAQLEGYFGFRLGDDLDLRDAPVQVNFELVPRWIVFFDAAKAWAQGDIGGFSRNDEDTVYDVGGGIALGDLGFFVAIPLEDELDRGAHFVVRLGSRF